MRDRTTSRFVGAQFVALALAWGSAYLFIKVALEAMNPAQVALGRLLLGASILVVITLVTRRRWPRGLRMWGSLLFISLFMAVFPYLLYAWAGQHIPSGLSGIYNATTPIATMVFALMLLPEEKLTRSRGFGLVIGVIGVVLIAAPWSISFEGDARDQVLAQLACLGANVCYAISYVLQRLLLNKSSHEPVAIAASQISLAAIVALVVTPFMGGFEPMQFTAPSLASILALGLISTGLAYIWVNNIIIAWGPTAASTVTYATPVVGVLLGIFVLGEQVHWNEPVGGLVILLGVLLSQDRLKLRRITHTRD